MLRLTGLGLMRARKAALCLWGVLLTGCLTWVAGARAEVSAADEKELGRKFALEARAKLPLFDDVEINRYVDGIGQKIVAALGSQPFQYNFYVVRNPHINAFAVPAGYIYVHGGLLTQAGNDAEIAGVLGHEIAHVNAHHLARQQEATQLLDYATLVGVLASIVHPAIGAGALAVNSAVQLKYRREFEQEADYLGAGYMRAAGYDPRGMLDFFKKMLDQQRAAPAAPQPYLLSHPLTEERLNNLEAVLHTRQWDSGPRQATTLELERVQLLARAGMAAAQDVVALYWRAADAQPRSGRARYLLGLAYLETGALAAARQTFEDARQLGFTDVDRDLGRVYFRLRQPETARQLLSRAAEMNPDDPLAHIELAKVLAALNETDGARREYERALELAPAAEDAHYELGMLEGRAGRKGEGFYHLGKAWELRGEYDKAVIQYENAAAYLPPESAPAQAARAAATTLNEYRRHRR